MKTSSNQSSGGRSLVNEPTQPPAAGQAVYSIHEHLMKKEELIVLRGLHPDRAAFIVRACNSHAALVEALAFMFKLNDAAMGKPHGMDGHEVVAGLANARAALAAAQS